MLPSFSIFEPTLEEGKEEIDPDIKEEEDLFEFGK